MIVVYGITDHRARPVAGLRGLDGARVESLAAGGLRAAVTCHAGAGAPPAPARDAVLAYAAVIQALHSAGCVLPVRFGTAYRSEASLRSALGAREEPLVANLRRVRGCVELGLTATSPAAAAAPEPAGSLPARSGRAYLEQRLAREQHRRAARRAARDTAEQLRGRLGSLAAGVRSFATGADDGPELRLAFLVPLARLTAFRGAVRRLGQEQPDRRLTLTGPWPPYSFVDAEEEPAHA